MLFDLTGKVVFVTGALNGVGLDFAKALADHELKGLAVIDLVYNDDILAALKSHYPNGNLLFVQTDVSDKVQLKNAFEKTVERFGQLDVVVNNAGMLNELDYEKTVNLNMIGTFNSTMLSLDSYLPKYKSGNDAIIVNISSTTGLNPFTCMPIYSITKQTIVAIGRTLGSAQNYERTGVRIVTICPSGMNTNLLKNSGKYIPEYHRPYYPKYDHVVIQSTTFVAQEYINIIQNCCENGSVWVISDEKPAHRVAFNEVDISF